jgi:hypothetical protein
VEIFGQDPSTVKDAADNARTAVWVAIGGVVTTVLTAIGTLYALLKKEKRTDAATEDKIDQSRAATFRKDRNEILERYSKDLARWTQEREGLVKEREAREKRMEEMDREWRTRFDEEREEHIDCQRKLAEQGARLMVVEDQVARLKAALDRRGLGLQEGDQSGSKEHPPLRDDHDGDSGG